jgi:phosphatidylglycerol:prolipoprotein diacylglycerol transferase
VRPVLFTVAARPVYSYPACLYLGLVAGVYVGAYEAAMLGVDADRFTAAVLVLVPLALVGARLWFVVSHWQRYRGDRRRIFRRGASGLAMYGGLVASVPASVVLLPLLGLPFGRFWDAATFTMLTGMIPTRVGCLLNGCCAGRATSGPVGLVLADHAGRLERRVPTQLLEAAAGALLLAIAFAIRGRLPFDGSLFLGAVAAYAAMRYLLEGLRELDATGGALRRNRVISVGLLVCSLIAVVVVSAGRL